MHLHLEPFDANTGSKTGWSGHDEVHRRNSEDEVIKNQHHDDWFTISHVFIFYSGIISA